MTAPGLLDEIGPDMEMDSYGRYKLPDPATGKTFAYTRVTTFAKAIRDTFALTQWELRMATKGLATRTDLMALAAATPLDDKKTLNKIADDAKEAAAASAGARTGSALHKFGEAVDRGETIAIPEPWNQDIDAYKTSLKQAGIVVPAGMIERTVIIPELGLAGTFDRIYRLPGDLDVIGDLKSGQDLWWLEIAIQLACYSRGTYMWSPGTKSLLPMPEVSQERAVVAHFPAGQASCTLWDVDLVAGWEAAQLCKVIRAWRTRKNLASPYARDQLMEAIGSAATVGELEGLWRDSQDTKGRWKPGHTAAATRRKHALGAGNGAS